ncbi:MAG: hypothetical protein Q8862_11110 [Bacteroidota bacterium]|nr:hypothetical protein [Bacteroidota bacterium]
MDTISNKSAKILARITSYVFHPLIIPSIGMVMLFRSDSYLQLIPSKFKQLIFLVFFVSTFLIPTLTLALMALSKRFNPAMKEGRDRIVPLLFTASSYFMGYLLLARIPASGVFRLLLLASVIILVSLVIISFGWKISLHLSGAGGLLGGIIALAFRFGFNPWISITILLLASGALASSRIILEKHTPQQVYAGFGLSFMIEFLILFLV